MASTPTFRAAATNTFSSTSTPSITKPAGIAAGDLIVLTLALATTGRTVNSWPSGFTALSAVDNGVDWQLVSAYKVAGESEPSSYTVTLSGSATGRGAVHAYSGVDPADPIDDHFASRNDTDATASTSSTQMSNSLAGNLHLIVVHWRCISTGHTTSYPAGYTNRLDVQPGTYTTNSCDKIIDSTGTLSSVTVTHSASHNYVLLEVLLNCIPNEPPNPPAGLTRADFDARDPARFEWTFDDDDEGDSQSAFKLRLREQGSGTWLYAQADGTLDSAEVWITSVNEHFDLAADELLNGDDYEWNVATKDFAGEAGSFAASDATFSCVASAVRISAATPNTNHNVVVAEQPFSVTAVSSDSSNCTVYIEVDTADRFDTGDLIQNESGPLASGSAHEFGFALTGSQTWYWRTKAKRSSDDEETAWSTTRTLNVDTGGALPADITPAPDGDAIVLDDDKVVRFTATVNHALTPTSGATLRLEIAIAEDDEFTDPLGNISAKVLGGQTASVSVKLPAAGIYWVRFRTLSDYGDDSAWDTYESAIKALAYFVQEPSWEPQIGPRPNRVFVRIEGGTTIKTASVGGLSADDYVDYWSEVPVGTTESQAQSTADAILAVLQARPLAVSGPIPLNVGAVFGREITVQWWQRDGDGNPIMVESASLSLARKEHDIDAATTTLHLGDVVPSDAEALVRILAKLSRR